MQGGDPGRDRSPGWSLNPGRYVGVAEKAADDFDFAEKLEELNEELEVLNSEARELEERIAANVAKLLEATMTLRQVDALLRADFIDCTEAETKTGPFGTQLKASEYVEHGTPVINVRDIGFGTNQARQTGVSR